MRVRRSGGPSSRAEAPLEAIAQALGESGERRGRAVAGEDDLAAALVSALKVWKNSSSVCALALEELDVVDEQHVDLAVAALEALGAARRGREATNSVVNCSAVV